MSKKMKDVFEFLRDVITSTCFECIPLDDMDIVEKAVEYNILYEQLLDENNIDSFEHIGGDYSVGDTVYIFTKQFNELQASHDSLIAQRDLAVAGLKYLKVNIDNSRHPAQGASYESYYIDQKLAKIAELKEKM